MRIDPARQDRIAPEIDYCALMRCRKRGDLAIRHTDTRVFEYAAMSVERVCGENHKWSGRWQRRGQGFNVGRVTAGSSECCKQGEIAEIQHSGTPGSSYESNLSVIAQLEQNVGRLTQRSVPRRQL